MRKLICLLISVTLISTGATGQERDLLLQDCLPVSSCLQIIEQTLLEKDNGQLYGDEKQVAAVLKARFGREARDGLLKKAIGDHGGWRNYAGGVLQYWNDWSDDDIPILKKALELSPGGWIANALADLGSDQAIEVLFDDLTQSDGVNQTGFALRNIGPKVLNFALPALSTPSYDELPEDAPYTEGWRAVASLIGSFGSRATFIADEWIAIANQRRATTSDRVAALRGLAAMNGYLGNKGTALHGLLRNSDRQIAEQAYITLVSTYDPAVARRFAESCKPSGRKWDEHVSQSFDCLSQLSDFGSNAKNAGDLILPFLNAPNKAEQLYGIEALGLIGYEPAIEKIEPFLKSSDWRLVYASVRALAQMNSKSSVPKIESAIQHHWLWELNLYAEQTVSLLVHNQPYYEILSLPWARIYSNPWRNGFDSGFGDYTAPYDESRGCEWQVWTYQDEQITFDQSARNRRASITLPDGELFGTDKGEFGGNLTWKSNDGSEIVLVHNNTIDMFSINDGFISIHGISHLSISYGFAVHITRGGDGTFSTQEIARFPAAAYDVKQLNEDLFAANASGRVFIFSKDGIKSAAYCDQRYRPKD